MSGVLDVETRRAIFEAIAGNPGLHLREISRRLSLKASLVEYHARALLDKGLIMEVRQDGYRRFFPADGPGEGMTAFSSRHRGMLHLLRQEIPVRIVSLLLEKEMMSHKRLLEELDVSGSTLSYHLARLRVAGMVIRYRDESGKGFRLSDPKEIMWLMMRGKLEHASVVDGFISTFEELHR